MLLCIKVKNATFTFQGEAIRDSLNVNQIINSSAQKITINSNKNQLVLKTKTPSEADLQKGILVKNKIRKLIIASPILQDKAKFIFDFF